MRYWWVNQNRTFKHEVPGGYLWSPKKNQDSSINHFYETMREVGPGDLVFSYNDTKIMALGIAVGPAYTCPKPEAFGSAGANWDNIGWRVDVNFRVLQKQTQPKQHMELLRQFLPPKYSPIREDGVGNQMYLAEIPQSFAEALMALIGIEADIISQQAIQENVVRETQAAYGDKESDLLETWDKVQLNKLEVDAKLTETEKEQIVKSRKGQGLFRNRVAELEKWCRVTHVDRPEHLIASHIKPWRISDNKERLDGENGLFLTPSVDHLFGNGFISFKDSGDLIVSPVAHRLSLNRMGLQTDRYVNVGTFASRQLTYLEYHRDCILLQAQG